MSQTDSLKLRSVLNKKCRDKIVRYFLRRTLSCPHSMTKDCSRCQAKWLREAINKATS